MPSMIVTRRAGVTAFVAVMIGQANPSMAQDMSQSTAPLDSVPDSKKLDQSNGVVRPPNVDPAIEKGAPATGDKNVVPEIRTTDSPTAQPK
jgi:hypothetical protein